MPRDPQARLTEREATLRQRLLLRLTSVKRPDGSFAVSPGQQAQLRAWFEEWQVLVTLLSDEAELDAVEERVLTQMADLLSGKE